MLDDWGLDLLLDILFLAVVIAPLLFLGLWTKGQLCRKVVAVAPKKSKEVVLPSGHTVLIRYD